MRHLLLLKKYSFSVFHAALKLKCMHYYTREYGRTISLTSVPCKIMERIIRDFMMKFLLTNELIAPEQHGFVMYKSCTINLLETFDIITQAIHSNSLVYLIFLDFEKAFDKVCHNSLIIKLKALEFDEMITGWI